MNKSLCRVVLPFFAASSTVTEAAAHDGQSDFGHNFHGGEDSPTQKRCVIKTTMRPLSFHGPGSESASRWAPPGAGSGDLKTLQHAHSAKTRAAASRRLLREAMD